MAIARRSISEEARLEMEKENKRRDDALAKINEIEGLKIVYDSEREAYDRQGDDNLTFYWDRGQVATGVKRNAEYGQGAIDLLADALMVDRSLIYKTVTLFAMYPSRHILTARMEEAIERGHKLTWSHMSLIVHVPEAKSGSDIHSKRHQMVQIVIDNKLSVRATQEEIMSRYRDDPRGRGEASDKPAVSLGKVLKQVATFSEKSLENLTQSFDTITERLRNTTGDNVKEEVIDSMVADAEALKKLADKAREAGVVLEREATRFRREKAKSATNDKPEGKGKKTARKAGSRTPGRAQPAE
jgi:hypothetical protein